LRKLIGYVYFRRSATKTNRIKPYLSKFLIKLKTAQKISMYTARTDFDVTTGKNKINVISRGVYRCIPTPQIVWKNGL